MVLLRKAIFSNFNLILISNLRPEDDVREVKRSRSLELIFNVVSKCIAYLEMEKLLPSFTQMQQKKNTFSLFLCSSFGTGKITLSYRDATKQRKFFQYLRPLVVIATSKSKFHIVYYNIRSLSTIPNDQRIWAKRQNRKSLLPLMAGCAR